MARPLVFAVGIAIFALPAAQGCTSDATDCANVRTSPFDQSCVVDSDCVAVFNYPANECCDFLAINVAVEADYAKAFAGCAVRSCNAECTNTGPCCAGGTCQILSADECFAQVPAAAAGAGVDAGDAATDTGAGDVVADTCPPSGCTGTCLSSNTHNVSTLFDGCVVWQCCVPDDAGPGAATDAAADANAE